MTNVVSSSGGASAVLLGAGFTATPARAADPTIPIIVKDTTSFYWQIVLAGARKAGQDLHVNVPELGATSRSRHQRPDLDPRERGRGQAGRHRDLAHAVHGARQADRRRREVGEDHRHRQRRRQQGVHRFLTTDNVQGGVAAADALAKGIASKNGGKVEGDVALITSLPGVGSLDQRAKGFKEELAASIPACNSSPTRWRTVRPPPASTS